MSVPEASLDLFDKRTFAHASTLLPDGTPHTSPVWIDHDAETGPVLFNTVRGRPTVRNRQSDPSVAASLTDPSRFFSVRGEVVSFTEAGADDHVDELAARDIGVDTDPNHTPEDACVIVAIQPDHVMTG
jgi:PPOX class probable F420-dependent enzyme